MSKVSSPPTSGNPPAAPAGGIQLYRALQGLADEYRMRAVVERDYDAGAIAMVLGALVLQAARAGLHIHLNVSRGDRAT